MHYWLRQSAIAFYCNHTCPIENLLNIVKFGSYIPHQDRWAHDSQYHKQYPQYIGKHVIFAYPDLGYGRDEDYYKFNQDIQAAMEHRVPPVGDAENYAAMNAVENAFQEETGLKVDINQLEDLKYFFTSDDNEQKKAERVSNSVGQSISVINGHDPNYYLEEILKFAKELQSKHSKEEITEIIAKANRRKGVLVYFNGEIFDNQIELCPEGHDHVMIISDKPLPASAISGIKFLSEEDEKAFQEMLT